MKKQSSGNRDLPSATRRCDTPEELLKSEKFAQFLSYFNQVRDRFACLNIVIPQEVAEQPELAKKVYDFYRTSEGLGAANDKGEMKFDDLARETIAHIRRSADHTMVEKKMGDENPPEWLTRVYPKFKGRLPADAIRDMERIYQGRRLTVIEMYEGKEVEKRVISDIMNNFLAFVATRNKNTIIGNYRLPENKIVRDGDLRYSDRMRGLTWREFYAEIDELMAENGLSAKKVRAMIRKMESDSANFYLLPVFLELLRRGYKVYPDLSI